MKLSQKGFSALEAILIVVIVVIVGGTGYYVYRSNQNANKNLKAASQDAAGSPKFSSIKSFADCKKAAGSKLLETFPEQCVTKDGKKFTDTSAVSSDPTASWYKYTAPSGAYTIRLADGWKIQRYQQSDNLYAYGTENVTYKKGVPATVTEIEGGRDGAAVGLFFSASDRTNPQGTQQSGFKTNDGLTVRAYYFTETTDAEGLGALPKGGHQYTYLVDVPAANAFSFVLTYGIGPNDADQHGTVEQSLKTLHVNN